MSDTGYSAFSTSISKTNEILHEIESAYGWSQEHRELSYHALRAVLHALRDRLTIEEATDFAAQLPLLVRGLFFENWVPAKVPMKMDRDEFLQRVQQQFVFEFEGSVEELVGVVMVALSRFITGGELQDIKTMLPKDIAGLLP